MSGTNLGVRSNMTSCIYKFRETAVGPIAEMYDMNGNKLAEAIGIDKNEAIRQARKKLGGGSVGVSDSLPAEHKKPLRSAGAASCGSRPGYPCQPYCFL